jgi:hypothetical protein
MTKTRSFGAILRKDAMFVWNALISVVFIGFGGLAVAATVLDLMAIGN